MRDVTDLLFDYLEAKRHLWNVHFRPKVKSLRECSALDHYEEIDRQLFAALVVRELSPDDANAIAEWRRRPWDFLRVAPGDQLDRIGMMLSDPITNANRKWNTSESLTVSKGADFGFVEFFDWNAYGHVTYPYVRVKVDARSRMPNAEGREALCEITQVRVFFMAPIKKRGAG